MLSSTIYTIGTALTRAHDADVSVDVLVDGQWIHGLVSAVDGHGVVLQCDDGGIAMLRVEKVDAVLVRQAGRFRGDEPAEPGSADDAHVMPAAPADRVDDLHVVRPRGSLETGLVHRHGFAG
ncbi:hypothetical protein [Nocardioides currus]|uniref:Uncharacterized protein n=1 Tax=Nocardioides currus TaxID=2133958 RepID=A0A2R7YSP9_9ACTN|nr:hypothetical protein [Nocardioides currus]PUA79420.1 hypothetical protein C7S10_18755 [Nocardioides currus]